MIVDESDCCGNGCSNCILDIKSSNMQPSRNLDSNNCLLIYRQYELIQKMFLVAPDIVKLKFKLHSAEDKSIMLYIPAGHHIMMKMNNIRRPYSPFWVDSENLEFEILVNLKPNGEMTKYIKQFNVKDFVEFIGPIGSFYHKHNEYENLIIFTQGIAIAPTIRIIEKVLENEDDYTKVHLVGCFRNLENFYFRDKLLYFKHFWNFNSQIYLSRQSCAECPEVEDCQHYKAKLKYKEVVQIGRLTMDGIKKHVNNLNSRFVICGSKEFEIYISSCLYSLAVDKNFVNIL